MIILFIFEILKNDGLKKITLRVPDSKSVLQ